MFFGCLPGGGGGTDLERGYGDVRPWRLPFHASPAARKGPISSKRVSSQDPLLRKFENFQLTSPQIWKFSAHKPPKFGNFQLTSPQIWKFSAHKPPNLEIFRSQAPLFRGKCQFAIPTLRKSGPHTPTWTKVECPPPPPGAVFHKEKLLPRVTLVAPLGTFAPSGSHFACLHQDAMIDSLIDALYNLKWKLIGRSWSTDYANCSHWIMSKAIHLSR